VDLRLQTCSDMYSDINKEKLTDTVNGCEILHQLIQASDKVVPVLGKKRCALGKRVSQKSCL